MPTASPVIPSLLLSERWKWASEQAISYLMQQAVENPDCISLAAGLVDQATLPVGEVRDAMAALLADENEARNALQYGTTPGSEFARSAILDHFCSLERSSTSDLGISTNNVVLSTGSQQLLSIVGDILFDPGDICLVAAPTYFVFLGVLNGLGASAIPIDCDDDGMCMEALEEQLRSLDAAGKIGRVKAIYLVSYYENPSGVSLSEDRRRTVLELARRYSKEHRIFILEDAAYREMRYDGPDLPSVWSLDETRSEVIYTQTFSKSFAPGLRVGFGVLPEEIVGPVCDRKGNEDFGSANLNQHVLAHVISDRSYHRHVEELRHAYRNKRNAMLSAADEFFSDFEGVSWVRPNGGLYVWMSVPAHIETGFESELFHRATQEEGVMYVPGELCFACDESGYKPRNHMRLSFGVQSPAGIREGMQRLSRAVEMML